MNVLITGAAGFVGSHLIEYVMCEHPEATIIGADRWHARQDNIRHLAGQFEYVEYDMTDYASTLNLVVDAEPDKIFHLAAQSYVKASWNAPQDTLVTNITGELNLFEAVRIAGLCDPAIQIACSSEEYGLVLPEETPITEAAPLRPLSPYGVSKVAQDMLGYQYHKSYGMRIIRTRAFNHTGPRRGEVFATSAFAKQIAEIEAGRREPVVRVGNLDAERDFTDVRDMVRAYWMATDMCESGEVYNICSGNRISIRNMLDTLLAFSPKRSNIRIETDEARMRPSDVPLLYGDASKFRAQTGWNPEYTFERTMEDLLNYWREIIRRS